MATVLITGGTGLIGTALSKLLSERGHNIIILTRDPTSNVQPPTSNVQYANWDIKAQSIDANAIKQSDHIIHLAGANVADKRWTKKQKKEIQVKPTHFIFWTNTATRKI